MTKKEKNMEETKNIRNLPKPDKPKLEYYNFVEGRYKCHYPNCNKWAEDRIAYCKKHKKIVLCYEKVQEIKRCVNEMYMVDKSQQYRLIEDLKRLVSRGAER